MNTRFLVVPGAGVAVFLTLSLTLAHAQLPGAAPFPPGETLTYEVDWAVFTAGKIMVTLVGTGKGGPSEIITSARSQGTVSLLYKLQDDYHSYFNPQTLCSQRISKKINEGRRHRDVDISFDGNRGVAVVEARDLNDPNSAPQRTEHKMPACAEDIVTTFYFARRQPLRVGQSFQFAVNDGGETQTVVAEVQAEEPLQTALGTRNALRVEPKIFGSLYKRKGRLLVWFSNDEQHVPLRLKLMLSVGTITANLKSISSAPTISAPAH